MINLIDKNIYKLNLYYSLFIAVYCCCSLIIPLQIISSNSIIKLFFIIFGIFLASFNLFVKKAYLYIVQLKWLILFFIFNIVTIILNGKYGYTSNIKDAIVFYIYFFSSYSGLLLLRKQEAIKIVDKFFKTIYCFLSVGSVMSLYQFLTYRGYHVYNYKGLLVRQGFNESRLFGVFSDPNYLSILIIISTVYIVTISYKKYSYPNVLLLYLSILINYIYIVLSGSRTAFLAMLLVALLISIYIMIYENTFMLKVIKVLIIFFIFLSSYNCVKTVSDNYLKLNHTIVSENKKSEILTLDRTDTSEENISNNRFAIWKGIIDLIPNKPIFGVSSGNWYDISKEYEPNNYIVKSKYHAHNGYLELLFYNGIVGFILMGIFIFKHYKKIILNISNNFDSRLRIYNFMLFIIFNIILFSNLLLSSTFYGLALLGFILFSILSISNFMCK